MQITIETENAAFDPDPAPELVRILRQITARLESGMPDLRNFWPLFDVNGNKVGAITQD